jgi:hypothetical protein
MGKANGVPKICYLSCGRISFNTTFAVLRFFRIFTQYVELRIDRAGNLVYNGHMIEIKHNSDYHEQQSRYRYRGFLPCIVCGKEVTKPKYWLHVWYGTSAVLPSEIDGLEPGGDTGFYPIGTNCVRSHPELKEYVHKEANDEV